MHISNSPFASKITGTGSAFPSRVVTNDDLSKFLDTNDEWIRERTGIRERKLSKTGNPQEFNSSLALQASLKAMEMAGKKPEDIDQIIYATCTPDTLLPSTACWLQKKLGAKRAWGIDLNAACSGFVFATATADQFIRSGQVKTSLVVGADTLGAFTNWKDRGSAILFGDAAGAAILEATSPDSPNRIFSAHMGTDGTQWELFHIVAGGSNQEVTPEMHENAQDKMQMKGREMFKIAVKTLADYAVMALESSGFTVKDLDWLIPHQANLRIIEAVAKRLDFPMEKVVVNIERYGNTSSATIPTALDEAVRDQRIRSGHLVLFDAFGAGITYGSTLVRW